MIVLAGLVLSAVLLLLPALITGDWHGDRMDAIERGDLF